MHLVASKRYFTPFIAWVSYNLSLNRLILHDISDCHLIFHEISTALYHSPTHLFVYSVYFVVWILPDIVQVRTPLLPLIILSRKFYDWIILFV